MVNVYGWNKVGVQNLYTATKEWCENHPEMKGSCVFVQMEEMRDMALRAYEFFFPRG